MDQNTLWHERLVKTMPFGSSTCSKAPRFLPQEPTVIVRGKGCRVWDANGKEYIDFRNGLGPVSLGYQYPEVDDAIQEQLARGIVFGHPSPLECEVSELLCELVPCAEQARFLKTGGEAVAACIRIARAYTHKKHILQIGYNGWLNSLASGAAILPRQASVSVLPGVPGEISALYHAVPWNDVQTAQMFFDTYPDDVAAVVVAANVYDLEAGKTFLPFLRELTRRCGALLIFDEIVTGFRLARGGAQEYFGVMPDLAVFAKAIANGMPLSAYVGSREIMRVCAPGGVGVSSTYGGELLSLAASKATLEVYRTRDVIGHIRDVGAYLWERLNPILERRGLPVTFRGLPQCAYFTPVKKSTSANASEVFLRDAYARGVSFYEVSYINYSHCYKDMDEVLERLSEQTAQSQQ